MASRSASALHAGAASQKISRADVARMLGKSVRSVKRLEESQRLVATRIDERGKHWFDADEVARLVRGSGDGEKFARYCAMRRGGTNGVDAVIALNLSLRESQAFERGYRSHRDDDDGQNENGARDRSPARRA